jgi:hypothetical protein
MMATLPPYCYATGTRSSRKIMRRCQADVACRVIVGGDSPEFRTIGDFREAHLARLGALLVEVLQLCALAGLAGLGTIALDGTKVRANASRHKAMSYDRMKAEEERLKQEIATLLAEAQATDDAEDARHGPDRHGDEPPAELARRQGRLAVIRRARASLEQRARAEAAEEAARRQAEGKAAPRVAPADAVPDPRDQVNFTDPGSRIMRAPDKGRDRCGNARAVANEHRIIPAADVTERANDVLPVVPMADQARADLEAAGVRRAIGAAVIDAGYYSEANATALEGRGIEPYVATERPGHGETVASAPRGRVPAGPSAKRRMAGKLRTKNGRGRYARRKGMIEPIFGRLKQVPGSRRFSLRGLASLRGEWRPMSAVHSLLRLWGHGQEVAIAGRLAGQSPRGRPPASRIAPSGAVQVRRCRRVRRPGDVGGGEDGDGRRRPLYFTRPEVEVPRRSGTSLVAGIVQDRRQRQPDVPRRELAKQLAHRLGVDDRLVADGRQLVSDRVEGPEDVESLAARRASHRQPDEAPQVAQVRPVDEVGRIDGAGDPLEPLGLLQAGPELLAEELPSGFGIGLGRDHAQLAALHPHPAEGLADPGRPPSDPREPLDGGGGLAGRAGRILAGVILERLAVVGQLAGGRGEVGPLEPLDAPLLGLAEVAPQGILADPREPADLAVRQAPALEVGRPHLLLHPGMGVVEAIVMEGVDGLGGEVDGDHRGGQRPREMSPERLSSLGLCDTRGR